MKSVGGGMDAPVHSARWQEGKDPMRRIEGLLTILMALQMHSL